jgi:RNA polymerase sigma factor (TIGR02999 family)
MTGVKPLIDVGRLKEKGDTLGAIGKRMGAEAPKDDLTALLGRWGTGTPADQERLLAAVQADLRRIAGAYMRRERGDHTLQPTALVNEAYLRLIKDREVRWDDRAHFFGIAARLMRQILVDHARKRRARKRGMGARADRSVSKLADPSSGQDIDGLALRDALIDLAVIDPRQAEIVEMRYFGGLTEAEVATVKMLSPATIRREIAAARFWLGRHLKGQR